ncbi:MAG TPA: hypothetical protein PK306_08110 [Aquabacterium sp.]|nr:hypothetical protein [Aquabacterium sp.]HQC95656.1 hypothetical protein [Aquabacterium sp.]
MATLTTDLYRALRKSGLTGNSNAAKSTNFTADEGAGSAGKVRPDYVGYTRNGFVRAPDLTWFTDANGHDWVRGVQDKDAQGRFMVKKKEGVSVSSNKGGFGYTGWCYFLLPEGTDVPAPLDVLHTPTQNDDGHHSIRCLNLLRRDAYEGHLDTLARAAVARAVEQGKTVLHFSA